MTLEQFLAALDQARSDDRLDVNASAWIKEIGAWHHITLDVQRALRPVEQHFENGTAVAPFDFAGRLTAAEAATALHLWTMPHHTSSARAGDATECGDRIQSVAAFTHKDKP
jgi:hypothetical protein